VNRYAGYKNQKTNRRLSMAACARNSRFFHFSRCVFNENNEKNENNENNGNNEKGSSLVGIMVSSLILLIISISTYTLFGGASQMLTTATQSSAALTASMLAAHDATLPSGYTLTAITGSAIIQPATGSTISVESAEQVQVNAVASGNQKNPSSGLPWFDMPNITASASS
jgi:hypothetical protein